MGEYLAFIILPISRLAATGQWEITEARKIFGLEEWESLLEQVGLFHRIPTLKDEVDAAFEELFRNPRKLNINEFELLSYNINKRHLEKTGSYLPKELTPYLSPFRRGGFHLRDYHLVYSSAIEPKLAIHLPTTYKGCWGTEKVIPYEINGVKIDGGDMIAPTLIPLSTLQKTDLDEFKKSIDLTKDRYLAERVVSR